MSKRISAIIISLQRWEEDRLMLDQLIRPHFAFDPGRPRVVAALEKLRDLIGELEALASDLETMCHDYSTALDGYLYRIPSSSDWRPDRADGDRSHHGPETASQQHPG